MSKLVSIIIANYNRAAYRVCKIENRHQLKDKLISILF